MGDKMEFAEMVLAIIVAIILVPIVIIGLIIGLGALFFILFYGWPFILLAIIIGVAYVLLSD